VFNKDPLQISGKVFNIPVRYYLRPLSGITLSGNILEKPAARNLSFFLNGFLSSWRFLRMVKFVKFLVSLSPKSRRLKLFLLQEKR